MPAEPENFPQCSPTLPLGLTGFLAEPGPHLHEWVKEMKELIQPLTPSPKLYCLLFGQSQKFHNWLLCIYSPNIQVYYLPTQDEYICDPVLIILFSNSKSYHKPCGLFTAQHYIPCGGDYMIFILVLPRQLPQDLGRVFNFYPLDVNSTKYPRAFCTENFPPINIGTTSLIKLK